MMNRSLLRRLSSPSVLAIAFAAAMCFALTPQSAHAGSRYHGSSHSGFGIGLSFGNGHSAFGFSYASGYRGYSSPRFGISYSYNSYPRYSCAPRYGYSSHYSYAPRYYAPPVVYAPRYCAPAPVYVAPRYYAPAVYSAPRYYSTGNCYPVYNVSYSAAYAQPTTYAQPAYNNYYPASYSSYQPAEYTSYSTSYGSYAKASTTVYDYPQTVGETRLVTTAPAQYAQAQNATQPVAASSATPSQTYPTSVRTDQSEAVSTAGPAPDGWQLIASGDAAGALATFAALAPKYPTRAYPKLGFAIASSMADDNDSAVFALRRAFEVDPHGMDNIAHNTAVIAAMKTMREKFVYQAGMPNATADEHFAVAALSYVLRDYAFAAKSLAKAEAAGDTSDSARNLRKAVDAVVSVRPAL